MCVCSIYINVQFQYVFLEFFFRIESLCINKIGFERKYNPCKNSRALKIGVALKSLGEKSCEIKGGSQELTAKMLRLTSSDGAAP